MRQGRGDETERHEPQRGQRQAEKNGQARAASRYAAACLASGDGDAKVAVALAKAYCSEVAVNAAQECVQMHGGIGVTWEHDIHLYLRRATVNRAAYGTPNDHLRRIAARLSA